MNRCYEAMVVVELVAMEMLELAPIECIPACCVYRLP